MPELPEVETVRRGLAPYLEGRVIKKIRLNRADLRFPFPEDFCDHLTGAEIIALRRRAKYLLFDLQCARGDRRLWISHLGMTGRFELSSPEAGKRGDANADFADAHYYQHDTAKHVHLELICDDGTYLRYADPRRFGYMDLISHNQPYPAFDAMGPEPDDQLQLDDLLARLAGRNTPIKTALLDQKIIAGLGNIYVCEALHHAQISPRRRAGGLGPVRMARLVPAIQQVIAEALEAGGSTLRDFRHSDGSLGYFQHRFAVYDRAGAPCLRPACTGIVQRIVQAGRSTFFCGHCQK